MHVVSMYVNAVDGIGCWMGIRCKLCGILRRKGREKRENRNTYIVMLFSAYPRGRSDYGTSGKCYIHAVLHAACGSHVHEKEVQSAVPLLQEASSIDIHKRRPASSCNAPETWVS